MSRHDEFPLPEAVRPDRLKALLRPVPLDDPHLMVGVATYYDHDQHGLGREHVRLQMVAVLPASAAKVGVVSGAADGVVCGGGYIDDEKGLHRKHAPNICATFGT